MATKVLTKISWDDLPEDCWELIFGRLDRRNRELVPISLVNKTFLAITDRLHTDLILPSCFCARHLPRLNSRFPNLMSIHLSHRTTDLDGLLRGLAESTLRLRTLALSHQKTFPHEAMRLLGGSSMRNTLTTLCFLELGWLTDEDLFVVADCFPYLHRLALHLKCPNRSRTGFTDKGVFAISARLVSLVSLNMTFNGNVSRRSFTSLSSNCPELSSIRANFGQESNVWIDYFSSFASLTSLDLSHVHIDADGLDRLSRANLKLRKLGLVCPHCRGGVSLATMCRFLKSCKSLTHLDLQYVDITKDTNSSDFAASIPNVEAVYICNGSLPGSALFDMLRRCPKLNEIVYTLNSVKMAEYMLDFPVHHSLRKLVLTGHGYSDETLAFIGSICPNLESFYFGCVPEVTEQGIEAMRARCANIKICERIPRCSWVEEADEIKNISSDKEAFSSCALNLMGVLEETTHVVSPRLSK